MTLGEIGWRGVLAATSALGWDVPAPRPRSATPPRPSCARRPGRPVRLVGCYHVSPHNTYTRRLTPAMLDDVLLSLRS